MTNHKSLVIVDDEPMNSMILNRRLSRKGFRVVEAYNGEEALNEIAKNPQSKLVLMDLMMPVMDGWQASEFIKERYPDLKITAVSAHIGEAEKQPR